MARTLDNTHRDLVDLHSSQPHVDAEVDLPELDEERVGWHRQRWLCAGGWALVRRLGNDKVEAKAVTMAGPRHPKVKE